MKIFVTGSEGFLAKEFIRLCISSRIEVYGCDICQAPSQEYKFDNFDIRSLELEKIIPENVDAVVHLAAIVNECKGKPLLCYDVNLSGTINVADAAKKKNAKQIIFASTEWVYGKFNPGEVKHEKTVIDPTKLDSDYALSKFMCEVALRERFNTSLIPTTILRFGIIYGPRFPANSAVDSLFFDVAEKKEIKVNSLATGRHFIHVQDIAEGIKKSLGLAGLNIINLEGERFITLAEVIETSKKILGRNPIVIELDPKNASERRVVSLCASGLLGWAPKIDLEAGLHTLINLKK